METRTNPRTPPTLRFEATLSPTGIAEKSAASTAALLTLPPTAAERLPSSGMTPVEGTIHGFPFRAVLESDDSGRLSLPVNRALQAAAGACAGDSVSVEITRVGEEPECRIPLDLRDALATAPSAESAWTEITPLARRDWILWITSAKQPDTRRNRITKACSMLAAGKRRPCCFGGLNWLTKDHPDTGGTWVDLPNPKRHRPSRG